MHQFSFDFGDPYFELDGWHVALRLVTRENVYALARERTSLRAGGGAWHVAAEGLASAGGQQTAAGRAELAASRTADGLEINAAAEHPEPIRCLQLILRGLPRGEVTGRRWERSPVPPAGAVLHYPYDPHSAYPLHTPLVFLADPRGGHIYFRAVDPRVRCKRFSFIPQQDGSLTVELIHEDAASEAASRAATPPWRIGWCADPASIVEEHGRFLESAHGLRSWETRADVPAWARDIALVVTLHGMHWTGYICNTYADMIGALEWVCRRIDGRRVLAFLPGWEGRYYWQYGDYRPEPRLGGRRGFRSLARAAGRLGVKLMPMFGANCANTGLRGFRRWGEPSRLRSPSGLEFQGNKPDWDNSRAHDPGWQAWLNPGAPAWRSHLLAQVRRLLSEYGLPAVFFDTHHIWQNDPAHPVYEGLVGIRDELRGAFPDLLLAGEGWYDALGAVTPISQVGAPAAYEWVFSRYCRTFAHLMWGEPGRGSTGVHEAGTTGFGLVPDAPYWLPSVAIADGTLRSAPERVEAVIQQALAYAKRYLA